jgi:hypothetical protein
LRRLNHAREEEAVHPVPSDDPKDMLVDIPALELGRNEDHFSDCAVLRDKDVAGS